MKPLTPQKKRNIIIVVIVLAALLAGVVAWVLWAKHHRPEDAPERTFWQQLGFSHAAGDDSTELGEITLKKDTLYLVVQGQDTAFFVMDTILKGQAQGVWYSLTEGSNLLESKHITLSAAQIEQYTFAPFVLSHSEPLHDHRYQSPICTVTRHQDIEYAQGTGYWASLVSKGDESRGKLITEGLTKSRKKRMVPLTMDVYTPQTEHGAAAPLIIFLHGGAFYVGDKGENHIADWCQHFASLGYVTASVNYRMGFHPTKKDISSTIQMASADLLSATHYLLDHAEDWNIDTANLFLAGTSAGAITALKVVFNRKTDVHYKAVANMWGAIDDPKLLRHATTSIVSFHGDADPMVPYEEGYPFSELGNGQVGKMLFGKMYGSKSIHEAAQKRGIRTKLYTFKGEGHALHENADHTRNASNFNFIKDSVSSFFYQELVPQAAVIRAVEGSPRHYTLDNAAAVHWHAQGGFILRQEGNDVWVVWHKEGPRRLEVSCRYPVGVGVTITKQIDEHN